MTVDRPAQYEVRDLPFGEQFLLWAIRNWVLAFVQRSDRHSMLHKGFRLAGIEEAYVAIDELLTIVSSSATTRIEVRCPHNPGVSNDEQVFIGMIAALQRSDCDGSAELLAFWLAPAGVRLAQPPARKLADLMALGGLSLRLRTFGPATTKTEPSGDRRPSIDPPARRTLH